MQRREPPRAERLERAPDAGERDWAFLAAGGVMGQMVRELDWAATALGPIQQWPPSLRTAVGICLASAHPMVVWWGPELVLIYNDAWVPILGPTKHPALGKPGSIVWPEMWHIIGAQMAGVLETGRATWSIDQLLPTDRHGYLEEAYFTYSYSPIPGEYGQVAGVFTAVTETTQRVLGERRLRILSDLGELSAAAGSTVAQAAAAVLGVLEHAREDVPSASIYLLEDHGSLARRAAFYGVVDDPRVVPPVVDRADEARHPMWTVLECRTSRVFGDLSAKVPEMLKRVESTMGAGVLDAVVATPLGGAGGDPIGVLWVGISPFRALDEEYRRFVDLLGRQVSTVLAAAAASEAQRRRVEELAELDRAKTAFFTNVSHELRTPLTLMLGPTAEMLAAQDPPLAPEHRERADMANRNAQRLLALVNTLLDFSRLEAGQAQGRFEATDLGRYTAEIAAMFDSAVASAGLTLKAHVASDAPAAWVDRDMWAKIVLNLLSNALKFTFDGAIVVELTHEDADAPEPGAEGAFVLVVSDTGVGIAPADQARLFERFSRVVGARSRTHEGSGIGLALVAELARLHGGTVCVESTPEVGSTFSVRIPAGRAHLAPDRIVPTDSLVEARSRSSPDAAAKPFLDEAARWIRERPEDATSLGLDPAQTEGEAVDRTNAGTPRPRVLIVDDNADMRAYLASLLGATYRVSSAVDGFDALTRVRAEPPDLVLTDVMMPNLDGFGLLAALRADPATAEIPVVMVSARVDEAGSAEGLEAGADDYLTKPFTARELLARVRANLELDRSRRVRQELEHSRRLLDEAQRIARVGSWELDLATGRLRGSPQLMRMFGLDPASGDLPEIDLALDTLIHPEDRAHVAEVLAAGAQGHPISYEARLLTAGGGQLLAEITGELVRDPAGNPLAIHGSAQDIGERRRAEQALTATVAAREVAAREHQIADELQASLLPSLDFDPDHLQVATYYRPGVEGTQVGGDWYDVIELGAGRTALVIGDVMGRGVRAAAVMGQLRSTVRAYARLDLPPPDVLELCDAAVRELGVDQIVTCIYAVYDPLDRSLIYANAGHLPPLLAGPDGPAAHLPGEIGAPLGGAPAPPSATTVHLLPGSTLALYTDGLVERRDRDIDEGVATLAAHLVCATEDLASEPMNLVARMLPEGPDDDVAVLLARVPPADQTTEVPSIRVPVGTSLKDVSNARWTVARVLEEWDIAGDAAASVVLLTSEMVTNAIVHGKSPVELRMRRSARAVMLEVSDGASSGPRRLQTGPDDENGRGLQLVARLAQRWGIRPIPGGKAVWCVLETDKAR